MTETATSNAPEVTVSELSGAIKRVVEDAFGFVRLRGEISGYKGPSGSGHVYFRLKDANAAIEAVIWKGVFGRMKFRPQEGLDVLAIGRVTTFPGSSKYQIVIESLEPAGAGALMALLEARRKALAAEGLFEAGRKRPLPYLPAVIGVVTSPTGAVIRDILRRLADRFPRQVLVWPVRVQGEGSAAEVARAIRGFNAIAPGGPIPRPDVLIVARGGGSLEDLWSFNEEIVVRAAAESAIPLISAVGHETDTTLIDFAADRRAPTPTAAAEMAVPVRGELLAQILDLARRNVAATTRLHGQRRRDLRALARALPAPERLLERQRQRLDTAGDRLPNALKANAGAHRARFSRAAGRLAPGVLSLRLARERTRLGAAGERLSGGLRRGVERRGERLAVARGRLSRALVAYGETQKARIARRRDQIQALGARLKPALARRIGAHRDRVTALAQILGALSYQGVLKRGFALIRDEAGKPVRLASDLQPGAAIGVEFSDGRVGARVEGEAPTPAAKPARTAKREAGGGQGSLF